MKLQHTTHTGYLAPSHIDMCHIVVPDKVVGAIIGAGGSMIKQIMEDSGARVTVRPCLQMSTGLAATENTQMLVNFVCLYQQQRQQQQQCQRSMLNNK